MERLAMWLQIMGAISFTIGCAFEKPDNSLQSQLRRAIEKEDYERAAVLRDKIKTKNDTIEERNDSETALPDNQIN